MKQCPTCKTTYTDDSLRYCLADGGTLVEAGEHETVLRQGVRVDIEPERSAPVRTTETNARSPFLKILIAVLLVGFLGLIVVGAAGVLFYINSGASSNTAAKSPTPTATPSPTPDDEKEKLQNELANLQKKLDDQKKAEANKTPPNFESDDLPTARVDSPKDGFLALRAEPDSEEGERLAKIPHGTVLTLESCETERVVIDGRSGRWCLVTYAAKTGWVFDAWLSYPQGK